MAKHSLYISLAAILVASIAVQEGGNKVGDLSIERNALIRAEDLGMKKWVVAGVIGDKDVLSVFKVHRQEIGGLPFVTAQQSVSYSSATIPIEKSVIIFDQPVLGDDGNWKLVSPCGTTTISKAGADSNFTIESSGDDNGFHHLGSFVVQKKNGSEKISFYATMSKLDEILEVYPKLKTMIGPGATAGPAHLELSNRRTKWQLMRLNS